LLGSSHLEIYHFFPILQFESSHLQTILNNAGCIDMLGHRENRIDLENLFYEELAVSKYFVDFLREGPFLNFVAKIGQVFDVVDRIESQQAVNVFQNGRKGSD